MNKVRQNVPTVGLQLICETKAARKIEFMQGIIKKMPIFILKLFLFMPSRFEITKYC